MTPLLDRAERLVAAFSLTVLLAACSAVLGLEHAPPRGQGGEGSSAGSTDNAEAGDGGSADDAFRKDGETLLTNSGLTIVSYGGYLNGEAYQQDGVASYDGYQYVAYWNARRHVVVARRALPSGEWSPLELVDYQNSADDSHNTISLGLCPGDGTLHLAFDNHGDTLHYRSSAPGLITTNRATNWAASSFSAVTSSLVTGELVTQTTYPRFVTEPGGNKLLFESRIGTSGSGDEYLWEYDSATRTWLALGKYISGISENVNAYLHGLAYTKGGSRLHAAWCWRDTPDASTNHDLSYMYSDDNGRTWHDDTGSKVASAGSQFVSETSLGTNVWPIEQNRGLINNEHMAVDANGIVHVLLSHLPDSEASDSNFNRARTKSHFFHYFRDAKGTWARTDLGLPSIATTRGKLAIASNGDVYAILPDLRIARATAAANFATWALVNSSDSGRFFSDPLIDTMRLATEDKLTIIYPQKTSPNIYALDFTLH